MGKFKKIELREVWKHEALDFTNWLAKVENLKLLGDGIGFDLKLTQTEAPVGSFNVDILAEEENTGRKIIIENQLEATDHDHLGKIITYASGYNASVVVWVVGDVREQHRQAMDWLNEHTDEDTEFYLIQLELWQIGDSPYAPKFELVSKPNDWAKVVRASRDTTELTETKLKQLEFWDQLKEYAKKNNYKLRLQKSYPQCWTNISIGNSDAYISLSINSRDNIFGVEIYIPDNKDLYQHLFDQKNEIETILGEPLEWMELPNKKASRIKVSIPGDFDDRSEWEDYFEWMLEEAEKLKKIFPKHWQGDALP